MKWIAGMLIVLEMGIFSHYGASEPKVTVEKLKQISTSKEPFASIDIIKTKLQFTGEEAIQPIALFSVDTELLASMKRGEVLTLRNIEHHLYQLEVKEKHYFRNSTSIRFQCLHSTKTCTASVEIGSTLTSMHLFTPQGIYEMETRNDVAYFYKK